MNSSEIKLNYQEREAVHVVRKLLQRKPEAAGLLMKDMTNGGAISIMLQVTTELEQLHKLAKAMSEAAAEIVKMEKKDEDVLRDSQD